MRSQGEGGDGEQPPRSLGRGVGQATASCPWGQDEPPAKGRGPPATRQASLLDARKAAPVSVKKLERVALARKLFRSQEGPPRPSRHPRELKQKLGLRLVSTHGDGL